MKDELAAEMEALLKKLASERKGVHFGMIVKTPDNFVFVGYEPEDKIDKGLELLLEGCIGLGLSGKDASEDNPGIVLLRLLRDAFRRGGHSDEWKLVCMLHHMLGEWSEEVEIQ